MMFANSLIKALFPRFFKKYQKIELDRLIDQKKKDLKSLVK